uniref:Aminopeptidase N n=1 Tax=Magnetococcus massalia (strain MO-1) TaxID=451514 RepID=A0A1S7LES5_MAGMO|nr:Aminopeptidase N [Candidatus Magnetococcus massalia]
MTTRTVHRLADYLPPNHLIEQVELTFELEPEATQVEAKLQIKRNPEGDATAPLRLDGQELELKSIAVDGTPVASDHYQLDEKSLTIPNLPETFELTTLCQINPQANRSLEGLYLSKDMFCTQCEAEGFRKITYYADRPDVLAKFRVTLNADKSLYPTLLSNGNRIESGELADNRHFATFEDPYPKPAYLFALVAGNLALMEDRITTQEDRQVTLQIYSEPESIVQCYHAMQALKKSMRWDESRFGLSYDLDSYQIVAVSHFNMGAMENKGLNIFNTKYVLASPEVATDSEYEGVESVIAHEYFHNWTGNRVTCRDWFQLSLKEGLTVFRDQLFSADVVSGAVQRIQDVRILRGHQFPEDAGPTAHPVQPDSYMEINNFYTSTIYNKGAEVIRMMERLLGWEAFRDGIDIYIDRHDGQAATVEQFVHAMETASSRDLGQFRLWYVQAGTPELRFETHWDASTKRYRLDVHQSCPTTPGQDTKQPLHIPITMALLDSNGNPFPLKMVGDEASRGDEITLELTEASQSFTFVQITEKPIPSLMRGFSAPVKWDAGLSDEELAFLWAKDNDPYNRWESGQQLMLKTLLGMVKIYQLTGMLPALPELFFAAFAEIIHDEKIDPALLALSITLPSTGYVMDRLEKADPHAVHAVRKHLKQGLAKAFRPELLGGYGRMHSDDAYQYSPQTAGKRSLKNICLDYLLEHPEPTINRLVERQLKQSDNMTDWLGAIRPMLRNSGEADALQSAQLLENFHARCKHSANALDKWLALQATMEEDSRALTRVDALLEHPDFSWEAPNKVRALVGSFCGMNHTAFHATDGSGYRFLRQAIERLDGQNPQLAARLASYFTRWRRMVPELAELMRNELETLHREPGLSDDLYEIVNKSLA